MLEFTVGNAQQNHTFRNDRGPMIFGRAPKGIGRSFVIEDPHVSRTQLSVEEAGGGARVTNYGQPITVNGQPLATNGSEVYALPIAVQTGTTKIEVRAHVTASPAKASARMQTIQLQTRAIVLERTPTPEQLAEWFTTLVSVQQAAAGSAEFYDQTARAIVDLIGLDRGIVLLRRADEWTVAAAHPAGQAEYSQTVLAQLQTTKQTVFEAPDTTVASLAAVDAFVASPILDGDNEVIGAVFGARDRRPGVPSPAIMPLEAQVVRVLAAAVSAGLARQEQAAEASRLRVQFERVFSQELVRELQRNPKMLEPADRVITVLFSDLRGFSRLSEQLDGASTFQLVGEVMDVLTERVLQESGVIIDYYGDGMAAMWNAPIEYDDHAVRACRAAIGMQEDLRALDAKWRERLGTPLAIGVGVHTGPARVGNAGSKKRQKYGPRGHTVNLASRIEGATKHAGVSILLSEATRALVGDAVATRRIGAVRVVGIDDAVVLHQLATEPEDVWSTYEEATTAFEAGDLERARTLVDALPETDGPRRLLDANLRRATPGAKNLIELTSK
ncbi:MAG: adenylate/guanylate cyclase domain-containing protein [Deltaproteobacteria bacterium]|jgi:adenylate cyclase